MCLKNECRDCRQTITILWRIKTVLRRNCLPWISICGFPLFLYILILVMCSVYTPKQIMLNATAPGQYYVTSTTPNATENYFYSADSGFNTSLSLEQCSLYNDTTVGLVLGSNEQGNAVLQAIFDELNQAFASASNEGLQLYKREFQSRDEMNKYVKKVAYRDENSMCFALGWKQFDPENNEFVIDISYNYGDIYENRLPQTYYENSIYCDFFLWQQGVMGFLQVMTSVTNKVISEVYKVPIDDYNFQVLYMPMDTSMFHNDFYFAYIGSVMPIVYLSIVKLSQSILSTIGGAIHEDQIQLTLKRAGMRKSVELYIHGFLTILVSLVLFPVVISVTVSQLVYESISFGYMTQAITVFVLNYILQHHVVMFALPQNWSGRVNKALEILAIIFMIQGVFLHKATSWYVYTTSVLPLNYISWYVFIGMRAYNREVDLQAGTTVFNDISLATIMDIGLYSLLVKALIIIYCWPVQISGSLRSQNSYLYMCKLSWWRRCCSSKKSSIDIEEQDASDSMVSGQFGLKEDEAFLGSISNSQRIVRNDPAGDVNQYLLTSEIEMIRSEDYEEVDSSKTTFQSLQIEHIVKKIGDKVIIDDVSLTCFKDEIFVLIGENGSGKTTILQSIAGDHQDLEGNIIACDINIKNGIRFLDDFIAFQCSESINMFRLTVEEHIEFYCRFRGIKDRQGVINQTLADFDLKSCSNIAAERVSKTQKKKLNVALALLGHSKIVLLDEPTAGLDIVNKRQIWERIIKAKENRIIIVATQDMQEAETLGDRIGLMQNGQLKKVGSPQFFKKFYNASPSLVFTFSDRSQHRNRENELKQTILSAVKPQYHSDVAFSWNQLDQLVFRVPSNISWQKMTQFVNMDALLSRQGDIFESVQLKKPSLAETFHIDTDKMVSLQLSEEITALEINLSSDEEDQIMNHSWSSSMKAMLHFDFMGSVFWRQLRNFLVIFFITILQEVIFLAVQINIPQKTLNYSDVSSIYENPMETFANDFTVDGTSTSPLFTNYQKVQNQDRTQVQLEIESWPSRWPPAKILTVNQTLTSIARKMNETLDVEEIITSQYTGPLGAYYIYNMDEDANEYSIAIYARQYSAAAGVTYGATMLQTLAQQITNSTISLSFESVPLPINNTSFPSVKTSVAEIFSVSLLTVATLLMIEQVDWYGRPIGSGLYHIQLIKGGYMSTYFLSKYIKCVLFNGLLCTVWAFFIWCFRLRISGFSIIFIWVVINPFFVFTISNFLVLWHHKRYQMVQTTILIISSVLGILVYLRSASIAFGYYKLGFFNAFKTFLEAYLVYPTNLLVGAVEWGFLYRRYRVWNGWIDGKETVDLSPYSDNSFLFIYLYSSLSCFIVYALLMALMQHKFTFRGRRDAKKGIERLEERETEISPDVVTERNTAIRASERMSGRTSLLQLEETKSEFAIVVTQLQCWRSLSKKDIGPHNKNSNIHSQGRGNLGLYSVKGVSFCVGWKENFVILGSASSGRTSMINNILGLERILTGDIKINGICSKEFYKDYHKNIHGMIGYQPQIDSIDTELTVKQHLKVFAKFAGIEKQAIDLAVEELLWKLCLKEVEDDKAGIISDGYKRRLSLGIALIGRPKIVILDDPLASVDPASTQKLLSAIRQETENSTLLVCTNNVEVAEALAQKLAVMHDGEMIAIGKISDFMLEHGAGYTIELQISLPLIESSLLPELDADHYGLFVDSEQEALEILQIMNTHLFNKGEDTAYEFNLELTEGGILQEQLDEILLGVKIPIDKFMKDVLIINVTMFVIRELRVRYENGVDLNSIQGSQVRISIQTQEIIQRNHFSNLMDQLVKRQPISCYTIKETTLDQVFSKLIQQDKAKFQDDDISAMRPSAMFSQMPSHVSNAGSQSRRHTQIGHSENQLTNQEDRLTISVSNFEASELERSIQVSKLPKNLLISERSINE